jgi:SAM-dependent methyltransferase
LELGCGPRKRVKDAITTDQLDYECVDIVGEIFNVLNRFPANSVDYIFSYHFAEHVSDLALFMSEMQRVLRIGGVLEITVPHFSHPHFYSDYTHRSAFGLYTFDYFTFNSYFKRTSPTYLNKIELKLEKVDLQFGSFRPYYIRHGVRLLLGKIVNLCKYTQEFYEENLCYFLPCSEIKFRMVHSKPQD